MLKTQVTELFSADPQPTSVGYPTPLADVLIVDPETKAPLERGTTGLLMCRGTMVMKEYVGNPEATAEVLADDGWFNTGDLAVIDENGWISIQDRAKDMIIRGGENVSNCMHKLLISARLCRGRACSFS
jgi:long-subunit acyl-CoA synthetase (AMP-forming)